MKKILIIDDDSIFLKVVNDSLTTAGYKIIVANDGKEGLALVKSESPDLILLDLLMPNIGGLDLLKILKEDDELSKIPVLILTNLTKLELVDKGLEYGARGYIIKSGESLETIKSSVMSIIGDA